MNRNLENKLEFCPICNGKIKFLIKRIDSFNYYHCLNCSLVFSNPLPSDYLIKEFSKCFYGILPQNKYIIQKIKKFYPDVKKIVRDIKRIGNNRNLKLLDYGGGEGYYSYCFFKNKYNVTFMDINDTVCKFAKEKFNDSFKVIKIELNGKDFEYKEKFDIIFCNQIIEHIKTPILYLKKLNKILEKNGIIIITTPNQMCLEFPFRTIWFKTYLKMTTHKKFPIKEILTYIKKPWATCDPPRHIYAFNKINLKIALEKAGFTPIRIFTESSISQYYSHKLYDIFQKTGIITFFKNLKIYLGIKLIKFLDIKNNFGGNLVVYAKKNN